MKIGGKIYGSKEIEVDYDLFGSMERGYKRRDVVKGEGNSEGLRRTSPQREKED